MIVSVIAGGWSLHGLQLHNAPGHMIGVNDAGVLLDVDQIVSMDRKWTEGRWAQLEKLRKPTWLRSNCLLNIGRPLPDWVNLYENERIPSMALSGLNGTNSGLVAINLAYSMKPRRVLLFGFDMCHSPQGDAHWYPPYPWAQDGGTKPGKYREWAKEFRVVAEEFRTAGIEIFNCSLSSQIDAFKKVDPRVLLR